MSASSDDGKPGGGRSYAGLAPEERRADQRRRLVGAALHEFARQGFHKASVDEIVGTARTSRSSFYEFFENREECMYAVLETVVNEMLDYIRAELFSSGPERPLLDVGVEAYARFLADNPDAARVILFESVGSSPEADELRSRTRLALAGLLRAVWAESDPEAAASPEAGALTVGMVGILSESMLHLVETGAVQDAPGHAARLCEVLRRVFAPESEAATRFSHTGAFRTLREIARR